MHGIPRGLIVLHPTKPFVDWVNFTSQVAPRISLKDMGHDAKAILIPEFDSEKEAEDFVRLHATEILEHTLKDWCQDRALWPPTLDHALLTRWFSISFHCMVFDMVAGAKPGLN